MKLVVVLEDLNDTGANRVSLDRAARWQANGDDVTVLVTIPAPVGEGLTVPGGPNVANAAGPRRQLRTGLPRVLGVLLARAWDADVVIAGSEVGFGLLLAWFGARLLRKHFAVTVQSQIDVAIDSYVVRPLRALTRRALRDVDLAVCVSHGLVRSTVQFGIPQAKVRVAANAVPLAELRAAASAPPSTGWDETVPVVVAVGRLVPQKGFDLLIRAHALALRSGAPPHQVVILGEGEQRAELEGLCDALDVRASVSMPGHAPTCQPVVSRADLFVLSSRWEGFSLSLAEALAHGTPCIAFDCVADPAEILDGGRYGRLLPVQDVAALAGAIAEHLAGPADLRARAAGAVEGESELFDIDRPAAQHRRALADLVQA